MRKFISLLLIIGIMPMLFTTGCKKDKVDTDFDLMTEYVKSNGLDLPDLLEGWVKPGSKIGVNADAGFSVDDFYIMDFRSAVDFNAGHIKDAHNVAFGDMLAEATKADKAILCVCYTGQTAARATGLLRLAGYSDAATLKWGMCGWHEDFNAKWVSNAKNTDSPNWTKDGAPTPIAEFSAPDFSTGKAEGKDILASQVNTAIGISDWKISNTDVLANPNNYFINNFWPQDAYDTYGHIKGTFRISDLKVESLKNLDPNETIVTYCYTGQTSSITTAWLHTMGFKNAKSLLFGANGMNYSELKVGSVGSAHKKSWHGESSASKLNYGYWNSDGVMIEPK